MQDVIAAFNNWHNNLLLYANAAATTWTTTNQQVNARKNALNNKIAAAKTANENTRKETDTQTGKEYASSENTGWNEYYAASISSDATYLKDYKQTEKTFRQQSEINKEVLKKLGFGGLLEWNEKIRDAQDNWYRDLAVASGEDPDNIPIRPKPDASVEDIQALIDAGLAQWFSGDGALANDPDLQAKWYNSFTWGFSEQYPDIAVVMVPLTADGQSLALGYSYQNAVNLATSGLGMPPRAIDPHYHLSSVEIVGPTYGPDAVAWGIWNNPANVENLEAGLTMFLHMLPVGATIDHAQQGNAGEAVISVIGDAGTLLGFGIAVKGIQGTKAAFYGARAAIVIDLGVGGIRGTQAGINVYNGETGAALANGGEALMRVLGVTPAVRTMMRNKAESLEAAAAKARVEIAESISDVTRFASSDKYVTETAQIIDNLFPGKVKSVNKKITWANGDEITDFDILLDDAVIQVKRNKARDLVGQMEDQTETAIKVYGLERGRIFGFAPDRSDEWIRKQRFNGLSITNDIYELLRWIGQ